MFGDVLVYFIPVFLLISNVISFSSANSVTWIDNFHGNITRYRRQASPCGSTQFRCNTGECIDEEFECDGKVDCSDESDETNACSSIPCPFFRCTYGACIRKNLECDGKQDCRDNSDETSPKCLKVATPTPATVTTCGLGQFRCNSGQCIKEDESCDGTPQCNDNSDESIETCSQITCPGFFYRCAYGACVARNARCNGIQECFDGSDEANCPAKPTPPTVTSKPTKPPTKPPVVTNPPTPGSCLVPNNPKYGEITIGGTPPGTYAPGTYVPAFSALMLKCKDKFKPIPSSINPFSYCSNGQWTPAIPTCTRTCPTLKSSITRNIKCTLKGIPESCENPIDGTIASIRCEPLYEELGLARNPTRICKDGSWDSNVPECLPACGVKHPKGQTNIIGGTAARVGDYPWQIAIYNKEKSQVCGGSLLDQRVVLSAAHCFTKTDGSLYPSGDYYIAAGKYYRSYEDERDEYAQYSTIENIHIPERYKGTINYFEADLAVLILKTKLNITLAVQPVCVDWNDVFEYQQLSENKFGVVAGWGFTVEGDKPSEELKEVSVPYISYSQCFEQVPLQFRKYLTFDKICAGYLYNGTAVCQGDSGGGLTFLYTDNKYYLRGIVSTSPMSESFSCDSNQYGTYTLVSKYIDFVNTLVALNRS